MKTTGAACEKVAAAKIATDRRFYMSGSQPRHWLNLIDWQAIGVNTLMTWYCQSDYIAPHLFAVLFFCANVWACLLVAVHILSRCCHVIEVLPSFAIGAALSFWWLLYHCPGAVLPHGGHHSIGVPPSHRRAAIPCHIFFATFFVTFFAIFFSHPLQRCCHPLPWCCHPLQW